MSLGKEPAEEKSVEEAVMRPDMAEYLEKGGMAKGSAIHRAVVRIQANYRGYVVRKVKC